MSTNQPLEDQEARTQRHLAVLDTLIAHGMDLANRVHHQATAPAEPNTPQTEPPITPETIALFDQISRAVRRAILVSRKLAEPLPLAPAKPDPSHIAANRVTTRKRVIREVEDTIHRNAGAKTETLQAELHERVESVDFDDDIGNRPTHEIIADICRDLGVTSIVEQGRFKRRTPQDLRALTARAAQPNSPAPQDPDVGAPQLKHTPRPPDPIRHRPNPDQPAVRRTGT